MTLPSRNIQKSQPRTALFPVAGGAGKRPFRHAGAGGRVDEMLVGAVVDIGRPSKPDASAPVHSFALLSEIPTARFPAASPARNRRKRMT